MTMDLKNDAFNAGMSETGVQLREFFYQVKLDEFNQRILVRFSSAFERICTSFFRFHQRERNFVKSVVYIRHFSIVRVSIGLLNGVKFLWVKLPMFFSKRLISGKTNEEMFFARSFVSSEFYQRATKERTKTKFDIVYQSVVCRFIN